MLFTPRQVAATPVLLERADFVFVFPNVPDSAVWTKGGTLTPQPVDEVGLGIIDPDNVQSLLYTHPTLFLTATPTQPDFKNSATFRCVALIPAVSNTSGARMDNAISWRMVLDDGTPGRRCA